MSSTAAPAATPSALALDSPTQYTRRRTTTTTVSKNTAEERANGVLVPDATPNSKAVGGNARPETPAVTYRRRKVAREAHTRPVTFLNVVTKICLLLVGVVWLGQMIWKWSEGEIPVNFLEYEERISGVEASFKKVTQMLQVQIEVVDKKIEGEIAVVGREVRAVEEKGEVFQRELRALEARSDGMEKYLGEFFSRDELEGFLNELKNGKGLAVGGEAVSLDDVRACAKEIVEKEIAKHAADGIGKVDYALAKGGGKVVRHSEPYVFGKGKNWYAAAKIQSGVHADAQKMLEPSFGEPGQCFALQGSSGFVEIKLREGIIPEAITLEHVSKSVAFDRSSAPNDCRIFGWSEGAGDNSPIGSEKMLLLAEFSYDLDKSNSQTFNVELADSRVINMVRLEFSSNHGNPSVTCIYRFRVHGYKPNSIGSGDFQL